MRICQPPENVSARRSAVFGREAEPAQHGRDAQVHAVAVAEAEALLQLGVAREHRIVLILRHRGVRRAVLDVVHLRLHVEQRLKRAAGLLEHRAARDA